MAEDPSRCERATEMPNSLPAIERRRKAGLLTYGLIAVLAARWFGRRASSCVATEAAN